MLDYVNVLQVEAEVQRLNALKASKMKDLVFKRQNELEEIYRGVHMDVDSEAARQILTSLIESGIWPISFINDLLIDPKLLLIFFFF